MGVDGGHPAAHRLHGLRVELGLLHPQSVGHVGQVGVQHDASVVEQAPVFGVLGISGEFHATDGQVVAAGEFGVDAEAGQGLHHRADKNLEVEARGGVLVHDKGKIQVACIVVHRPAAGQAPHNPNPVGIHKSLINLLGGVLIFAHHNGVAVLPEHKIGPAPVHLLKDIFLQRQIKIGVRTGRFEIDHCGAFLSPAFPAGRH